MTVPPERAVLNKERATGTYRLSAYFMGKTIAETPLELVLPFIFAVITYWMVDLSHDGYTFIFYIVILWLFVLMGTGIGTLIGAAIVDVKKALTMSVIVVLASILLGTQPRSTRHDTLQQLTAFFCGLQVASSSTERTCPCGSRGRGGSRS